MMSRLGRQLVTLVALTASLALTTVACSTATGTNTGGSGGGTDNGGAKNKTSLATFVTNDLGGDEVDLANYLGKDVVLLSFWSTYCEPCKAEMPVLQRLHDTYTPKGFKLISISLDGADTVAGVKPYIRSHGYTFTVVIDEDTTIANAYNPRLTAPFTILIDRQGKIFRRIEGFQISEAKMLEDAIKGLLAKK